MSDPSTGGGPPDVTQLMWRAADRDAHAAAELLPLVYEQLRELARHRMAQERGDHTLEATALVHEAYVRLVGPRGPGGDELPWANRAHFFSAAAEAMRRILIDHARARAGPKRGGGRKKLPLDVLDLAADADPTEILALDEAVSRLEQQSPSVAAVVRLRFFAGLSVAETAEALGVSTRTVEREWTYGRAWLARALDPPPGAPAR